MVDRSPLTQDRAFRVLLLASLVFLAAILSPFLYGFAIAAVLAVVTWPTFDRLNAKVGKRPRLAAGLMTGGVLMVIGLPLGAMLAIAVSEAVISAQELAEQLSQGSINVLLDDLERMYAILGSTWGLDEYLPPPQRLVRDLTRSLQQLLLNFAGSLGSSVPSLVGGLGRVLLDLFVFCIALFSCYLQGPQLLKATRHLSPLRPEYLEQLFDVFRQLSTNVAVGMVAAGIGQGVVAAVGFWLAGVSGIVALGLFTAVTSVVPVVGSMVVWAPVALWQLFQGRIWAALFVAVWSIALTASVDNLIKPFLFRNRLRVSPLLMLLVLLGGLITLGPEGLVVGPFVLVSFLTLYTLYVRDFVGEDDPADFG